MISNANEARRRSIKGLRPVAESTVARRAMLLSLSATARRAMILSVWLIVASTALAEEPRAADEQAVSYYKQVRPIFQKHCHGCHQPAKQAGEYVMTTFEQLCAAGASELPTVVPEEPGESFLLNQISPNGDGDAEMPKDRPALAAEEIALVRRWIEQGALDDTPPSTRVHYSPDNPPAYALPPITTAIDFSPDGELLAVAGHHEVLLHSADGSRLEARLIGLSERIESIQFSPDGKRLAITGGLPARMGEVQVWDVAKRELELSLPITFDTVYGASWSPDGKLLAFGCSDATLRAIEASTGEQVLFQGAHSDWVLDTVFSTDGSHLVSTSRDRSLKLVEVATERFVDNITSITPGALSGGINAVARHPQRDELLVGGADGVPKTYRMHRQVKRVIGDDSNRIRQYPTMPGRIFAVAYSPDGGSFAAASSLDGTGAVHVFATVEETALPGPIKAIQEKVVTTRSAEEKKRLDAYHTDGATKLVELAGQHGSVYAVAFSPDGKTIASAGLDGIVRLNRTSDGALVNEFVPVPMDGKGTPGE